MPKHTNDAGRTGGDPSVDSSGPRLAEARSVTGIVTDPLGRPRQCVRFAPDGESPRKEPMSDVQGRFTLEDVSPDQKTWIAYSHASRLYGLFTLPETAPAEPVNVILTLGEADLEGRVVGPDGKALAKQKVEIVASTAEGVRFVLGHRPETDAYGYYSHGNVPCGEGLTIQARLMGADGGDTAFSTVPLRTRANQFLIAMPVLVAARARIQPDFDRNMKDDGMLHCGGHVVDDAGRPIPNVRVRLSFDMPGWMSTWIREAATDERGHWHRPLPPECIDLRVTFEHPEYYPAASRGRPPREELTDGSYTVAMRRGLVLEGTVVDEQGEPVENALVCAERPRSFTPSPYNQINENSTMARTLRDGSFCIRGLSPGEKNVIVYSDYYAPVVQAVDVREGMAPACVTLSRGRTYRGRVVDVGGDPIENVRVGTQRWQSGTERYWMSRIGVTDTQGMFVLENLPAGQIELNVGKKGYLGFSMDLPHDASQVDQAVMYEVPVFTGRVLDADTNEPIRDFEIVNGICSSVDGSLDWSRFHRTHVEDANGAFTHQWGGWHLGYPMSYACCLKIEAQGYLAGVCSPIEFGKTCDPLTVRLEKGTPIVGTVLQADGGPAASAQLAFVRSGEKAYVDRDQFSASSFSYQAEIMTTADADGRFELPPTEVQGLIVAVHRSGYAQVQSADFKGGSAIRLTAWSRVEGVIDRARIDEQEIEIALYTLEENPDKQVPCIYWLLGRVTPTGETFALDCVPAVPLAVGRICRYEMHDATYFVPQPGQTYTIRIGAHGRAVAGRIVPPADASVAFTDPRRVHAVAFRTDGPGGIPAEITAIGQSSFTWLWRDKEDVYTPSTTQRKRFVPTIADDGSFTFNGLEPGRYEFLANAHAPLGENVSCGRGVLEAVAVSRFTVPDDRTTSTIRVPDIRLRTLTYPQVGEPAPLFEAEALDGATIRLADLRGKVVLLDFWATWCKPCVAQMPELQKLYEQFGARADFAMIGLSVDWDVEEARTLVAAKQLAWPQVCLGDMESSQVVKRYGIGGIPTAICVDAAGNIVARGTSLDQLRREIANALGDVH